MYRGVQEVQLGEGGLLSAIEQLEAAFESSDGMRSPACIHHALSGFSTSTNTGQTESTHTLFGSTTSGNTNMLRPSPTLPSKRSMSETMRRIDSSRTSSESIRSGRRCPSMWRRSEDHASQTHFARRSTSPSRYHFTLTYWMQSSASLQYCCRTIIIIGQQTRKGRGLSTEAFIPRPLRFST